MFKGMQETLTIGKTPFPFPFQETYTEPEDTLHKSQEINRKMNRTAHHLATLV